MLFGMRKNEREIRDQGEIDAIIRGSQVCRLGLADGTEPYIVPLCFGYDGRSLYFHCANEGRKLEILGRHNRVCFEFDVVESMVEAEAACDWSIRYRSVMGTGTAHTLRDPEAKRQGLACLMAQYAPGRTFSFPEAVLSRTTVIRVDITGITGKQSRRVPGGL